VNSLNALFLSASVALCQPAHLLDARLGRRQLLPQRGAFTPSGLAKIFGDDAGVISRHWPAEWLTAVSRRGESLPAAAADFPDRVHLGNGAQHAIGTVPRFPGMWRIRYTDGTLSDMVNLASVSIAPPLLAGRGTDWGERGR
jgi:hypothetical protein